MLSSDAHNIGQVRTIVLATDQQNSIIAEHARSRLNRVAYCAYGHPSASQPIATRLGFNGELSERILGWYLLGNGYRAYNPTLMRFHSPDSWSPFGKGGLNAYMYCEGDPRNFTDPTGHVKFLWRLRSRVRSRSPDLAPIDATAANARIPVIENVYQRDVGATNPGAGPIDNGIPFNSPPPLPPRSRRIQQRHDAPSQSSIGRSRSPTRNHPDNAQSDSSPNFLPRSAQRLADGSIRGTDGVIRHPDGVEVGLDGVERMSLEDLQRLTRQLPRGVRTEGTNQHLRRS